LLCLSFIQIDVATVGR